MGKLEGKRVAVLVADGFEQVELTEPVKRLHEEGATTEILSIKDGKVKGWQKIEWGDELDVDELVDRADPEHFDGLLLPGGVMNADKLRTHVPAIEFIRKIYDAGKPIAAICHAPWALIESAIADGLHMTSYPSLQNDLRNAGADWVDEEVVVDRGVVTSRKPADIPAFNDKMVEELSEGRHQRDGGVKELAESMRSSV